MEKNDDGVWVPSASYITYAPTRSCANDNDSDGFIDTRADSVATDGTDFSTPPPGGHDFDAAEKAFTYGLTEAMGEEVAIAPGDVNLVDITAGEDATNMTAFDNMTDPTASR